MRTNVMLPGLLLLLQAEVLSSLSHRNVVQFLGAVTVKPNYCIVTGLRTEVPVVVTQGGVTPIDTIVTSATGLVNPYTKEGVESLCILLYTSINVHIVNGQWLKFNVVNG